MDWYYVAGSEQRGPFTEEAFEGMVREGRIRADTLVWNETLSDWKPCGEVMPVEQLAPADPGAGDGTCSECGRKFSATEMIVYGDRHVCSACKPVFFQRMQEGAPTLSGGGTGETPNAELTARARTSLSGTWGLAVGFSVLYILITQAMANLPYLGALLSLVIGPAFMVGQAVFFITLSRRSPGSVGMLFDGFKLFGTALGAYVMMTLIVLAWMLVAILPAALVIGLGSALNRGGGPHEALVVVAVMIAIAGSIPAIRYAYSYTMVFYILADDKNVGVMESLRRSRTIMNGNRFKLFLLYLRFLGWVLLGMLTLFIGMLWVYPYMQTATAHFYEDVRGLAERTT